MDYNRKLTLLILAGLVLLGAAAFFPLLSGAPSLVPLYLASGGVALVSAGAVGFLLPRWLK